MKYKESWYDKCQYNAHTLKVYWNDDEVNHKSFGDLGPDIQYHSLMNPVEMWANIQCLLKYESDMNASDL